MNSMLRQTHIRASDLQDFLCSYDSASTTAVSIWAKAASNELKPGSLVFILEPITLPFGLISFVRKEEEDSFRVAEFAIVVRLEDGKSMALSITNNTYDLRFLESLVEERARKAVIDRKRFSYVAAAPIAPLSALALKELERIATLHAKGGSRRSFMADNANPNDEPALALLIACGVHMQSHAGNKQPLDIGLVCQSLFSSSDGKHQDSNRTQLKSLFVPIKGTDAIEAKTLLSPAAGAEAEKQVMDLFEQNTSQKTGEKVGPQEVTGFNLLQSWGGEKSHNWDTNPSLITQITDDMNIESPVILASNRQQEMRQELPPKSQEIEHIQEPVVQNKQGEPETKGVSEEDVYKHLSDAITDLLGPSDKSAKSEMPVKDVPELGNIEAQKTPQGVEKSEKSRWPAARSFDKLPAFNPPLTQSGQPDKAANSPKLTKQKISSVSKSVASEVSSATAKLEHEEQAHSTGIAPVEPASEISGNFDIAAGSKSKDAAQDAFSHVPAELKSQLGVFDTFETSENFQVDTGEQTAIFSAADIVPEKLDDFQEPRVVMNERASLMNRLESQVARAAKKLAIKATEIEQRLTASLDILHNNVIQEDKDAYAELVISADSLTKQFELLFDTLKTELAEKSATSREKVRAKLADTQKQIQDTEKGLREVLIDEFKQNQTEFKQLIDKNEKELNKLVSEEIELLHKRLDTIDHLLNETSVKRGEKLGNYFENFKSRVDDKVLAVTKTSDYQMEILSKDIESSLAENIDKLRSSKEDFFGSLERLINVTEIALSRQVRDAQTKFFLPRLKERKQIVEGMMHEMTQTFAEHSFSQAKAQSEAAENSLILARQQLKELVGERLAKLDMVGRNQQVGLEEIFKSAAEPLEQNTGAVLQLIKQAEQEVGECESLCNKLAEAYSLDNDPKLTVLRQDVYNKVDGLKAKLRSELEVVLESNCLQLEDITKHHNVKLSAKRAELVQQIRISSDKGLQSIRQAIHDAYDTVQSQRETYME